MAVILLPVLVLFPIMITALYWYNEEKLQKPSFIEKFGTLYDGLNVKRKGSQVIKFVVAVMARNFILVTTLVYL